MFIYYHLTINKTTWNFTNKMFKYGSPEVQNTSEETQEM